MVKKSMVGALIVLLVLTLAACGSSKKKKSKSKTHNTQPASSLVAEPKTVTTGGALTVTYNGCKSGDQIAFSWTKSGSAERGSLGTVACSGSQAVLRLSKFTATAVGSLQLGGQATNGGRNETTLITVKAS
ncbi:hypothetical protein ACIRBX_08980 [Kitasatospora sp. NPDC096147]|uniref:hypothetical protein n=1 Tax=Kitasatospora sp. NPDC096147 TaxID=3364093 RepID=UPI003808B249